jgi:FMN phosphatase YigB (HAD superfamily)
MKKKIIFFDGDGTIWYPKKTKDSRNPGLIYLDKRIKHHKRHLILKPKVLETLKILKKKKIIVILLSTSPRKPEEADALLREKVIHFRLDELFDEIHSTRDYHSSKPEFIINILKKRKIPKSKALMVGDSYDWDYKPVVKRGIDALLIESEYGKNENFAKKKIKRMEEIFNYIF